MDIDVEDFKKAVAEFISYDSVSCSYNDDKALQLARRFKCAKSTVVRWIGLSTPHPNVRKAIVDYILEQNAGS